MKADSKAVEIIEGMRFVNPTKKEWPYQVSCVDGDIITVSWIEGKDIISTSYDCCEVVKYINTGIWNVLKSDKLIRHPFGLTNHNQTYKK